ncbi:DUF3606 domain-containing protein [Bacillus sp. NP157]|nr:DUF3606 domain-containing protein [Bacillus sp. NP157]
MTDHLNRVISINPDDPHDLALWALVLHVSPATVLAAVHQVGSDAVAVQRLLTGRSPGREGWE